MTDFLLELLSEEIPARMQDGARAELGKLFATQLTAAGLSADDVTIWSTPRRLALIARGLPLETAAVSEEYKGPRTSAPPQALEGFLRKTGLAQDQLEDRDGVWFATVEKPGRATVDVLAEAIPAIVRGFSWPKSMRWGRASTVSESLRWVRPLQGIVAMLGDALVRCEVDGIASGTTTKGHRFHSSGDITIGGAQDYAARLRAAHVIIDQEERRAIIRERAQVLCAERGLTWIADEALVAENAGLTEWPVPLLGDFDPAFLDVPPEVVRLTLATNQKYFVCAGADGNLAPAFICTANIEATDGGAAIVAGNRKVLAARLSDARFFWEQDKKTRLAVHAEKLSRITFHEKLGTVADKVERVAKLARWLVEGDIVRPAENTAGAKTELINNAQDAAWLCKADLVTEMVGEFPELQGVMGGYYARVEGLPDAVADAIRDHYKPVGQGDAVPTAPVTVAVSLADKLDTLAGFFMIEERPTGSKDPFALRRAAIGVLRTIVANDMRLSIWAELLRPVVLMREQLGLPEWEAIPIYYSEEIQKFIADRLKAQQREAGVRHDLIDAVFALGGEDDLVRLLARVKALQVFVGTTDGVNLLAGYKRAANILKKEGGAAPSQRNTHYQPEPAEAALIAALDVAEPAAAAAVADERFEAAMAALASLRGPIDNFFETVTVNDSDENKRQARLALLARLTAAVNGIADFSKIEG